MDISVNSWYILIEKHVFLKHFKIFENVFKQGKKVKSSILSAVVTELKHWSILSLYIQNLVMLCSKYYRSWS